MCGPVVPCVIDCYSKSLNNNNNKNLEAVSPQGPVIYFFSQLFYNYASSTLILLVDVFMPPSSVLYSSLQNICQFGLCKEAKVSYIHATATSLV